MLLSIIISIIVGTLILFALIKKENKIKQLRTEVETYKNVAESAESMYEGLRKKIDDESHEYRIIHAEYCTSDSDTMKYKTDSAMESAIKNRLSMLVANNIKGISEPRCIELENGTKKYSYFIKVKIL